MLNKSEYSICVDCGSIQQNVLLESGLHDVCCPTPNYISLAYYILSTYCMVYLRADRSIYINPDKIRTVSR